MTTHTCDEPNEKDITLIVIDMVAESKSIKLIQMLMVQDFITELTTTKCSTLKFIFNMKEKHSQ
jgi:hypothetical protein